MKTGELNRLLIKARKVQGLNQLEVAELAGVGETVVYKLESGREDVTLKSFVAVLSALGVEIRCRSPLGEEVVLNG